MGPPDYLPVHQVTTYNSTELTKKEEEAHIKMIEAPIESTGYIGIVERFHVPLLLAYIKSRQTLPRGEQDERDYLQISVYSMTSTMGPGGLCSVLLVFLKLPRPVIKTASLTQLEMHQAIEEVKTLMLKETERRPIKFALNYSSGAKGNKSSSKRLDLPAGYPVLLYRTKPK